MPCAPPTIPVAVPAPPAVPLEPDADPDPERELGSAVVFVWELSDSCGDCIEAGLAPSPSSIGPAASDGVVGICVGICVGADGIGGAPAAAK